MSKLTKLQELLSASNSEILHLKIRKILKEIGIPKFLDKSIAYGARKPVQGGYLFKHNKSTGTVEVAFKATFNRGNEVEGKWLSIFTKALYDSNIKHTIDYENAKVIIEPDLLILKNDHENPLARVN